MNARIAGSRSGSSGSTYGIRAMASRLVLEEVLEQRRRLDRLVALEAVAGALDGDDPRRRLPASELLGVLVGDDTAHRRAAQQHHRDLDVAHVVPEQCEVEDGQLL